MVFADNLEFYFITRSRYAVILIESILAFCQKSLKECPANLVEAVSLFKSADKNASPISIIDCNKLRLGISTTRWKYGVFCGHRR